MKLIKFVSLNEENNPKKVFINPLNVETVYQDNDNADTIITMISGKDQKVKIPIDEVLTKLGIEFKP